MSKENDYVTAAPPEFNEIGDAPKACGKTADAPRRIEKDFTCRGWQRGSGYTHEIVYDSEIFLDTDSGQMDEMNDVISMSKDQFAEYLWKWSDEYFGPDSRENFVKTATKEENIGYKVYYSFSYHDPDDNYSFIGASPEVSMSDIVNHIGKNFPEELAEYECTFDDNQDNGRK